MRFPEEYKVVPIASDMDVNASATNPCDSINMTNYHRATFIINFQDLGGAALYCKLYSGTTDAALTSALTFNYAFATATILTYTNATTASDILAANATSANLSIAHATYDNYMLIVEVEATAMDLANNEEWLTLSFPDTDTGATGNLSVVAILEPRYGGNISKSALN
ncbi:hypothetical protein LCGC14_0993610 [marine sediment metagenome]|uniref:Uncharacterized protein n=1 Tax=marine sediment metagenome TaxID=412755 RepID=A0A0F9RBF6_9ZZZZ|nr:hypothetical protein [Pricia sp.]